MFHLVLENRYRILFAACVWLTSVASVFVGLNEIMRIVVIAVMTGVIIFAGIYEWVQKEKDWRATIGFLTLTWAASTAVLYFVNRIIPAPTPLRGPLIAADDKTPELYCSMRAVEKSDLVMLSETMPSLVMAKIRLRRFRSEAAAHCASAKLPRACSWMRSAMIPATISYSASSGMRSRGSIFSADF
jgi:hypothetical protein